MNDVLTYLLKSSKPLLEETELAQILKYDVHEWQGFVDEVRGSVVTFPGKVGNTTQINLTPIIIQLFLCIFMHIYLKNIRFQNFA